MSKGNGKMAKIILKSLKKRFDQLKLSEISLLKLPTRNSLFSSAPRGAAKLRFYD